NLGYEVEWGLDTAFVALSSAQDVISVNWTDQNWNPHVEYHPVEIPAGESIDLSIGLNPDSTLGFRGLEIDEITVLYEPSGACPAGDPDYDGAVTVQDIIYLVDMIMSGAEISGYTLCTADFNLDGDADILDLIALVELIIGG
ncbi:MAG: hypothetical protein GXO91_00890, partial [FCB group bacterium]|nr:hypothetical protein [FCB group bacterium]